MELSEALENTDLVVLDVETHITQTFTGKTLMGVALGIPRGLSVDRYYVLPDDLHRYKHRLSELEIVAHNVLFDAEIMKQNDCPLNGFWWDTMTMAHINNENEFSYKLDALCKKYIGRGKTSMKELEEAFGGWNNIPNALMGEYAKNDADITWSLFLHLTSKLAEQGLADLYKHYQEYLRAASWIQAGGIVVDWEKVQEKRDETEQELKILHYKKLRYDPAKRSVLDDRLYKQLKLPIIQRNKQPVDKATGKPLRNKDGSVRLGTPKTDVAVLQRLRERFPQHEEELTNVLRYRNLQKANGNWYAGYQQYQDDTGLLHPNFKVHGTKTGRLSCEAPNLQQIPRDYGRVKCLFRDSPSTSEVLVELDYSQIELRVAAYYSKLRGDPTMYNIYEQGEDVHTRSTELVGAFDQIADRKEARQVGKTGNFLWIYGGGAETMSTQLFRQFGFRSTVDQCQEWTNRFHEAYPGFQACIGHAQRLHQRDGYVTFWNGRRRRIRELDKHGRRAHRKAFNSRVQGGCGQLLMYGLIRLHKASTAGTIRSRVVNTVHDSIWAYVPVDNFDYEIAEMTRLLRLTPEKVFKLPFEIDAKVMVQ